MSNMTTAQAINAAADGIALAIEKEFKAKLIEKLTADLQPAIEAIVIDATRGVVTRVSAHYSAMTLEPVIIVDIRNKP